MKFTATNDLVLRAGYALFLAWFHPMNPCSPEPAFPKCPIGARPSRCQRNSTVLIGSIWDLYASGPTFPSSIDIKTK